MRKLAKWPIWLGWLIGVPLLMWTISGLFMVARPIEEVRGEHLWKEKGAEFLPSGATIAIDLPGDENRSVTEVRTTMEERQVVTRITYADGSVARFGEDGREMGPLTDVEARLIVAERIEGGDAVAGTTAFEADNPPSDFRRPMPVWQIRLEDGTHVYVGRDTGEIEAVRTQWWRAFDFMWGLHIMDLQTREDTSHPILILFAVLAAIGSLMGTILLFRRRKARVSTRG